MKADNHWKTSRLSPVFPIFLPSAEGRSVHFLETRLINDSLVKKFPSDPVIAIATGPGTGGAPFLSFPFLTFAYDTSLWAPDLCGVQRVRVSDDHGIMFVWLSEVTNSGFLHRRKGCGEVQSRRSIIEVLHADS